MFLRVAGWGRSGLWLVYEPFGRCGRRSTVRVRRFAGLAVASDDDNGGDIDIATSAAPSSFCDVVYDARASGSSRSARAARKALRSARTPTRVPTPPLVSPTIRSSIEKAGGRRAVCSARTCRSALAQPRRPACDRRTEWWTQLCRCLDAGRWIGRDLTKLSSVTVHADGTLTIGQARLGDVYTDSPPRPMSARRFLSYGRISD